MGRCVLLIQWNKYFEEYQKPSPSRSIQKHALIIDLSKYFEFYWSHWEAMTSLDRHQGMCWDHFVASNTCSVSAQHVARPTGAGWRDASGGMVTGARTPILILGKKGGALVRMTGGDWPGLIGTHHQPLTWPLPMIERFFCKQLKSLY